MKKKIMSASVSQVTMPIAKRAVQAISPSNAIIEGENTQRAPVLVPN